MVKKTDYTLNFSRLDLLEQRGRKEDEIEGIITVLTNERTCKTLLLGREFWISFYNRRKAEYEAFCIKNDLKMKSFLFRFL